MGADLHTRMTAQDVRKDTRLLGDFVQIFCDANHPEARKYRLSSVGVEAGAYGRKAPVVCDECAELLVYSEQRRAYCPKDPKPFCSYCDTHCYRSDLREQMREVMRYAGPRSMWHGHAIDGIKHLLEGRRHAAAAQRAARRAES